MSEILAFYDVWVEYDERIVLEDVQLSLEEGAFVSVVGPSGAGKSTLLRLVLGQEAPSRGAVSLDGKRLRAEPGPDRGVVFQRYSVFPHLNALENVIFGLDCRGSMVLGRLSGAKRREAKARAEALLTQVGLGHAMGLYPAQMSGGMQQRLAIAQALIMRPRILLLDEPFGALDPGVRRHMHGLITELWREHRLTVLMVTHDLNEAFELGTRVLALGKRRNDPQAPHRYGSTVAYDFAVDKGNPVVIPPEITQLMAEAAPSKW